MRIFIVGPTNVENCAEIFRHEENRIKYSGHTPANPLKFAADLNGEEYTRKCVSVLTECGGISCIDGWENSLEAKFEVDVAAACGIPTVELKLLSTKW